MVLRLLVGRPEDQTERALAFLDTLKTRGDRAVVSALVVTEVLFACQIPTPNYPPYLDHCWRSILRSMRWQAVLSNTYTFRYCSTLIGLG